MYLLPKSLCIGKIGKSGERFGMLLKLLLVPFTLLQ